MSTYLRMGAGNTKIFCWGVKDDSPASVRSKKNPLY
jgi:hypothetical protein